MGRDWFSCFSMKSRKEREREERAFFQWAFPYGKAQQERVKGGVAHDPGGAGKAAQAD